MRAQMSMEYPTGPPSGPVDENGGEFSLRPITIRPLSWIFFSVPYSSCAPAE